MILQAKDPNINVKLKPWDREAVFGLKIIIFIVFIASNGSFSAIKAHVCSFMIHVLFIKPCYYV